MLKRWIQLFFGAIGGFIGYYAGIWGWFPLSSWMNSLFGISTIGSEAAWLAAIGAVLFFFSAAGISQGIIHLMQKAEERVANIPVSELFCGMIGFVAGLLITALFLPSAIRTGGAGALISIAISLLLGAFGYRIGVQRQEELVSLLTVTRDRGKDRKRDGISMEEHKILDTSVIIDGRIADICKTGFIEGTLVIPEFVLEELQHIADSSDLLKRNRGRRGLDILNKIQKELDVRVLIYEGDFEEIAEVDSKLVRLAKVLQGKVVTNDFNLNKVCELQGVSVLNINDLANAVKPVVLPGEEILVQVIKDGKEYGQGVAYLDDGTMIVVEGGRDFIGMNLEVLVTSVLQTSAGRMIFAKPKLLEKAQ